MTCFFCENQDDIITETDYWKVFISPNQTYLGRCFVVLKRHCGDLAELEKEEWEEYAGLVKRLEAALRKSFGATMFNWTCLMNDAYK
jgi:diadenosine tetraphosphate (Ap4A) HIT family hydrolase